MVVWMFSSIMDLTRLILEKTPLKTLPPETSCLWDFARTLCEISRKSRVRKSLDNSSAYLKAEEEDLVWAIIF